MKHYEKCRTSVYGAHDVADHSSFTAPPNFIKGNPSAELLVYTLNILRFEQGYRNTALVFQIKSLCIDVNDFSFFVR